MKLYPYDSARQLRGDRFPHALRQGAKLKPACPETFPLHSLHVSFPRSRTSALLKGRLHLLQIASLISLKVTESGPAAFLIARLETSREIPVPLPSFPFFPPEFFFHILISLRFSSEISKLEIRTRLIRAAMRTNLSSRCERTKKSHVQFARGRKSNRGLLFIYLSIFRRTSRLSPRPRSGENSNRK